MKINVSDLNSALSICNQVSDSEDVIIECTDKYMILSKASSFNKVSVKFKGSFEECKFAINVELLQGILRGLKEIDLTYVKNDHAVKFKSGNKSGILSTVIYKKIDVLPEDVKKTFEFSEETRKRLMELFPTVLLSPTPFLPESEQSLEVQANCDGSQLNLLCADRFHSVYCVSKLNAKKFEINIPVSYFRYMQLFDEDFSLSKDDNCIYMYSKNIKISLPQVISSRAITASKYSEFIKNLGKPLVRLDDFDLASFSDALSSSSVVKTNVTDLYMVLDKSDIKIQCESELGKVYAKVECKGKVKEKTSAIIQQANISDILNLMKAKKCTLDIYENFFIYTSKNKDTSYTFVCSVGQKQG